MFTTYAFWAFTLSVIRLLFFVLTVHSTSSIHAARSADNLDHLYRLSICRARRRYTLVEIVPTSFGYVSHAGTHFSNTRPVECRRPVWYENLSGVIRPDKSRHKHRWSG